MFRTSSVHHQERFVQAVFVNLVCGNTRTTRHVQPLRSCWTAYILQDNTRSLQYQVKALECLENMESLRFCITVYFHKQTIGKIHVIAITVFF